MSTQTTPATLAPAAKGAPRRTPWQGLLLIVGILGPGLVTASAGNDVGGIATYSQAGAQFGYQTLWTLIPLAIALVVVQEMCGRMGAVTGKGLAGLIREQFGVKIAFLAMAFLFFTNLVITSTEFAGIATASEIYHISRFIAVPVALVLVFLLVLRFPNKVVERVFVAASLVYLTYIVSAVLAKPDWHEVAHGTFVPSGNFHDKSYVFVIMGLIGTTISPYMQFFLQSAVVEKGARARDLFATRLDLTFGSILAIAIAGFMIIANAATIYLHNQADPKHAIVITTAADVAIALKPLAGDFAKDLFAFGILNAGLFTATVLPLATAYVICEAFGFEAAIDRKFSQAPIFYGLFAMGLVLGAGLVLIPGLPLLQLILVSQAVQGIILPAELVLMLIIINRYRVMGEHTNSRTANIIAWATVVVVGGMAVLYSAQQLFGGSQ